MQIKPLAFKECVKGDAALCGSMLLDDEFMKILRRQITPAVWDALKVAHRTEAAYALWEKIKRTISDNPIPRTVPYNICGQEGNIWTDEIRRLFDRVAMPRIVHLIEKQLQAVRLNSKVPVNGRKVC
jgi:hypothetical protein